MRPQPQPVAVVDLDGVMADTGHRMRHLRGRPDWDAFFAGIPDDPAHAEGLALYAELTAQGLSVVYLSGRPERTRADTTAWLNRHGVPGSRLVLRPDTDRSPAPVMKVAALRHLGPPLPQVMVDDDRAVLAAVTAHRPALVTGTLMADWQLADQPWSAHQPCSAHQP